jgi:hypothetical protein
MVSLDYASGQYSTHDGQCQKRCPLGELVAARTIMPKSIAIRVR